ncbi:hypothetical protein M407DRAFT_17684 [Tulasnella calospora MUT 4182]|uniref:Uncharacterized protein n=1 Tax=Tulasnella calospora MUT 4182 TaxID=1051891 RepID=A0A0C3QV64_9AGAM|nr:hypothetical protein M407DRAFT_17684 [Tulasnella calospora MUT 4182]
MSLSGLRTLTLNSTCPTFHEFVAILQASPDLQFLSLKKTWLETGLESPPNSFNTKVFLPRLRGLHIYEASAYQNPFLLDRIEALSLETFEVTARYQRIPEDFTQLCESSGRYIGAFPLPCGEMEALAQIGVMDNQLRFGVGGRTITIRNQR